MATPEPRVVVLNFAGAEGSLVCRHAIPQCPVGTLRDLSTQGVRGAEMLGADDNDGIVLVTNSSLTSDFALASALPQIETAPLCRIHIGDTPESGPAPRLCLDEKDRQLRLNANLGQADPRVLDALANFADGLRQSPRRQGRHHPQSPAAPA